MVIMTFIDFNLGQFHYGDLFPLIQKQTAAAALNSIENNTISALVHSCIVEQKADY